MSAMNHDEIDWDAEEELYYPKWWLRTITLRQWHCFFPSGEKRYTWTVKVSGKHFCKAARVYQDLLRDIRRSTRAKAGMPCGVDVFLDDKQIEPVIKHGRMHVGPHGRLV